MWGVQRSHGARSLISEWRLEMKLRWERLPELVHTHTLERPYSGLPDGRR
jgi:hypothetical protein